MKNVEEVFKKYLTKEELELFDVETKILIHSAMLANYPELSQTISIELQKEIENLKERAKVSARAADKNDRRE